LLKVRLRGLYERLPPWLQVQGFVTDNDHAWHWSNDSRVLALPTTAGDSYTATLVFVDEADLVPDLAKLLAAVKPTIDAGGRLILLSRVDKSKPQSVFKRIYTAGKQKHTDWATLFLPWQARPDRNPKWYQDQATDILHRTGSLDDLFEQYPATDTEALAPRSLDKRIPAEWLRQCYVEQEPLDTAQTRAPAIPALTVYALPQAGRRYVMGADPAEGNPTSDDSALVVLDQRSGEEVAALSGRLQPSTLAAHADALGRWYNQAAVLVERNNHGHAVLLWLRDHSRLRRLNGHDGSEGWLSSSKGKSLLYDRTADLFRDAQTILHSFATFAQLASIDGSTLRAPEGEHDDRADAYALACVALTRGLPPPNRPRILTPGPMGINPHCF
jgi:Terminase RNaseH-like domain